MYIFELLFSILQKKLSPQIKKTDEVYYEEDNCEHLFVPIDSTNKILACSKCGLVVKKDELKRVNEKRNIFEN